MPEEIIIEDLSDIWCPVCLGEQIEPNTADDEFIYECTECNHKFN